MSINDSYENMSETIARLMRQRDALLVVVEAAAKLKAEHQPRESGDWAYELVDSENLTALFKALGGDAPWASHYHRRSDNGDACAHCGRDLRDPIHLRGVR